MHWDMNYEIKSLNHSCNQGYSFYEGTDEFEIQLINTLENGGSMMDNLRFHDG